MYQRRQAGWKNLLTLGINGELSQGRPLRIGAALNTVRIAEKLVEMKLVRNS